MIQVDTSIWVDHLRSGDAQLNALLEQNKVVTHPFVVGEIACGSLKNRASIFELLHDLPSAVVAEANEVLSFIEQHKLHGKGIGYVDAHLLASTVLTDGAKLWSRDKRLQATAELLGCAFQATSVH